jgi:hypothetical protein
MQPIDSLLARLAPLRARLLAHPVYGTLESKRELQVFMEHHVFAVWDFMSLAKALQRALTCVDVPWTPRGDRASRRFINEIILGEESDGDAQGGHASHFESYVEGMRQAGARTDSILALLAGLARGESVNEALVSCEAPEPARAFVRKTFLVIHSGSLPAVAAAFTLGREDVIPEMFRTIVARLDEQCPGELGILRWYLDRHVELDEGHHAPMARAMLASACGGDARKWEEAEAAAVQALEARLALWDGVRDACRRG